MINIEEIKNRDPKAFNDFVNQTYEDTYRLIFSFLKNAADSEDLIQDVYLEVYKNISGFKGESDIKTWLYRIAVNRSLNFLKKNAKHRTINSSLGLDSDESADIVSQLPADQNSEANFHLESKELKAALVNAIDGLPERQKTAFTLFHFDGFSYQQISEIMEISLSSTESLMFRAKAALKKDLAVFYKNNCL